MAKGPSKSKIARDLEKRAMAWRAQQEQRRRTKNADKSPPCLKPGKGS